MACDRTTTIVKSEIVLSMVINTLARCVSGKASVGLEDENRLDRAKGRAGAVPALLRGWLPGDR